MRKFRIGVSYEGSIVVEVEAGDEDTACKKARDKVERMNDEKFLHGLDPQWAETNIIEEIKNNVKM